MGVGFIGLGIMGSRMAANLQKHGHDLVVFNRTREKAVSLLEGGAVWADSPSAVARQVEILFTVLAHPDTVVAMALGADGFLDHLRQGALWVDCSTVNPSFSRRMAQEAGARQIRFLDAPVAGTKGPAAQSKLMFSVGGEEADLKACQGFFDVMGRRTVHVGGHGMGSSLKMVLNLLLAEAMAAFSEAAALGQSLGIGRDALFDILIGGPVVAPFVAAKVEKIVSGNYEADFPLKWTHKDLHLAAMTAFEQDLPLPIGNAVKETYALAAREGLAEQDFAAVYRLLNDGP
jgi:3-hydroxyisobutyrate dehydrogenase/glyoxylate/succinic semialdehyde reductase